MRLFQFIVPLYDNAGKPVERGQFEQWESALVDIAGGLTKGPRQSGVWLDEKGKEYRDESIAYTVALGQDGDKVGDIDNRLQRINAAFFALFSDQLALFRAEIGTARIIERPHNETAA